ncbi:MAG: hypothetical protein GY827_05935 [Cytophagales bacterium]|nr:hypothetical protein [Cytophagales bacterium]
MNKLINIILISILITSCDYHTITRINNQSNTDIIVEIDFDSSSNIINNQEGLITISIDTIKNNGRYKMISNSSGKIEFNTGKYPYFSGLKKISVLSKNDTLTLKTKDDMVKAFNAQKEEYNGFYDLTIKR